MSLMVNVVEHTSGEIVSRCEDKEHDVSDPNHSEIVPHEKYSKSFTRDETNPLPWNAWALHTVFII